MKASDRLLQSRKQSASCSNRASESGRLRPHSGIGRVLPRTSPPGASSGTSGRSGLSNWTSAPSRPAVPERPAETRMQPAGVRRALRAGIGDFDGDCERVGARADIRAQAQRRTDRPRGCRALSASVSRAKSGFDVSTAKVSNLAKPCRPSLIARRRRPAPRRSGSSRRPDKGSD